MPSLSSVELEAGGEDDLLDLALARTVAGEKKVLHHLLGDRRGAAQPVAVDGAVVERGGDPGGVEAVVAVEVLVLGRDERLLDLVGNLVDRREDAALAGELVHQRALARVDAAERRRLVALELRGVGKVAAVDGDDRGHRPERHDRTDRQPAEQEAEKAKQQVEHDSGPVSVAARVSEGSAKVKTPRPSERRGAGAGRGGGGRGCDCTMKNHLSMQSSHAYGGSPGPAARRIRLRIVFVARPRHCRISDGPGHARHPRQALAPRL